MNLPEIAADVAQALELEDSRSRESAWRNPGTSSPVLWKDGSNLTEAYWFKRCCEWLAAQCHLTLSKPTSVIEISEGEVLVFTGPIALAPAALVSAVKQQEKQND